MSDYSDTAASTRNKVAGGIMSRRFWEIVLLFAIALSTGACERVERVLQAPDGINLLKNGSFEDGVIPTDPTADERFTAGPNVVVLCDGSTRIDHWVASGLGPLNPTTCSNGKTFNVLDYVANPDHCEPNVPPCPNSFGIAAQEGNRFVNLVEFFSGRPPRNYGSVSQDVQTNVGQRYELSFFVGSSSEGRIVGDKSGAVSVEIAGVVIPDNPFPAPPPLTASNWPLGSGRARFGFTAVNETTTLTFHGTTVVPEAKGTAYIGLDNVSLQKVCNIVFALTVGCP